jgi:hypothetical protein
MLKNLNAVILKCVELKKYTNFNILIFRKKQKKSQMKKNQNNKRKSQKKT